MGLLYKLFKIGFDNDGYDKNGFDKHGFNKNGYDIDGFNIDGFDLNGFGRNGLDKDGYDLKGFHYKTGLKRKEIVVNNEKALKSDLNKETNIKIGQEIYHNNFYKGKIVGFNNNSKIIIVEFDKVGKIQFKYPDSIGRYIFIEKTQTIIEKENFINNLTYIKEFEYEEKHYKEICDFLEKPLLDYKKEKELLKYGFNDYTDSFDNEIMQKWQNSCNSYEYYKMIRNEPYFARIDYIDKSGLYIGKIGLKDKVIEWTDPIASLYYEYQMYIGNKKYNLSLVRDFEIIKDELLSFNDIYSKNNYVESDETKLNEHISDSRLLKVIESNRESKKIHEIITSIQSNQYKIITCDPYKSIIVLGCAGSGKTMIMYHRLKYILRNNTTIKLEDIYLISPTSLLALESKELSSSLQIKDANIFSSNQFNLFLIFKYYNKNKIPNNLNDLVFLSNSLLPEKFLFEKYKKENINNFIISFRSILFNRNERKQEFILNETQKLLKKINLITGGNYNNLNDVVNINDQFFSLLKIYNESIFELKQISTENIYNIIKHLENGEKDKSYKISILKNILDSNLKLGSTRFTKDNKIYIDENCLTNTFKLYKSTNWNTTYAFTAIGDNCPFYFFCNYSKIVEQIQLLVEFVNNNSYTYMYYIIQYLIECDKQNNSIELNKNYEYELFIHLFVCQNIFKSLFENDKFLFVDEFQDLSYTELAIYQKVLPNSTINFYGDFNQCINIKGLSSIEKLEKMDEFWLHFQINENYRNSYDVTNYVNKKFNMKMMPIGIKGQVIETSVNINELKLSENGDRVACIIADNYKNICMFKNNNIFNLISTEISDIVKDKINVLPISMAKGMEFERVYVITEDMNDNEQYVAYTRALNELYILK